MDELKEFILSKLEELVKENKVNGKDILLGISLATEIVEECFQEFNKNKQENFKCKECNNIVLKEGICQATKNYLDIIPHYNKNYNVRVCPSCGVIFNNEEGFEQEVVKP